MNCPNCKNPIQLNSTECEWCGSEIFNKDNLNKTDPINSDLDVELLNIIKRGNLLNAVVYKKDNSNLSLKESKVYVEKLAEKNGLVKKKEGVLSQPLVLVIMKV